jgi:8-oxo-dGTP pyrophosphatase MutT (NUDIX family)
MAPSGRRGTDLSNLNKAQVKHAAVLALFVPVEEQVHLLLTKRVTYPGVHSGQMSFPGGRKEIGDPDYQATALRETHEEIGVPSERITLKGALTPLYIPPSNFYVEPFVGILNKHQPFTPEAREVESIHLVPFDDILNEVNVHYEEHLLGGIKTKVPFYLLNNQKVWGATAMIISELKSLF